MAVKSEGRMIRRDISKSHKIAQLSPHALSLFNMLIPHYNAHGKMNGNLHFIKGEVVPLISWFTLPMIEKCLKEITQKTNVKWYEIDGIFYIQSLNWTEHQKLRAERLGNDLIPDYPEKTMMPGEVPELSGVVPPEVEGKEEVEGKGKGEKVLDGLLAETLDEFVLPDWIPEETWIEFQKVRKKKKAACTPYAHKLIVQELIRLRDIGNDPVKVINKSINSGWADVYPLKEINGNGSKPQPDAAREQLKAELKTWQQTLERRRQAAEYAPDDKKKQDAVLHAEKEIEKITDHLQGEL